MTNRTIEQNNTHEVVSFWAILPSDWNAQRTACPLVNQSGLQLKEAIKKHKGLLRLKITSQSPLMLSEWWRPIMGYRVFRGKEWAGWSDPPTNSQHWPIRSQRNVKCTLPQAASPPVLKWAALGWLRKWRERQECRLAPRLPHHLCLEGIRQPLLAMERRKEEPVFCISSQFLILVW